VRTLFICVCVIALLDFLAPVNAEMEIQHQAPVEVTAGMRISLKALISDDSAAIELVRAYFKTLTATDYLYAEMRVDGDAGMYFATLPAPAQDTAKVDYFLLIKNTHGAVVKSQNFVIDVAAEPQTMADARPVLDVVLEPSEFANVDGFHGRMLRLTGDVAIVNSYGETRTPAETGYVVRKFETVRTGTNGIVVLDFDKDPVTVLDGDSQLNVRTPTWFSHLAGKAYFAFQRLIGVSQPDRVVNNTVASIGIRGTTFLSYDEAQKGVALKEGSLRIARSRPRPLSLLRDGVAQTTNEFILEPQRQAMFQGARVTESGFTPTVLADFARLEAFAAGLLSVPQTAEQPRVDVHSEAPTQPSQLAGFDDYITLKPTPAGSQLGIEAAAGTVVASSGASTAGISPWILAAVAGAGAIAVASSAGGNEDSSGNSGGSGSDTPISSNFVGSVNLSCNTCDIAFVDLNAIQDDYYDLYVNDILIGPVNNPPGGTVPHTIDLLSGPNTMELRFTTLQCCSTDLEADFNNGEAITPFSGTSNHVWTLNAP